MKTTPLRSVTSGCVLALSSLLLASCSALTDDAPTDDGELRVVAAFYPLEYVTQRVAGDLAEVEGLTTSGQEPHDLELGVSENATLAEADVVVMESDLQAAVADAVATAASDALVVDVSSPDFETGDASGIRADDPHFWQDPLLMADLADATATALAEADPEHRDDYVANAATLREDLEELDQEYVDGLASCTRDTVVVSHDAFAYLDRYGLAFEPVAGLSPGAEPSPADLARLQQLIASDGVTTVFSERLASPRLTQTLAEDAGVTSAVLDPLEGLDDETAAEDYLSLMRQNLDALRQANDCR